MFSNGIKEIVPDQSCPTPSASPEKDLSICQCSDTCIKSCGEGFFGLKNSDSIFISDPPAPMETKLTSDCNRFIVIWIYMGKSHNVLGHRTKILASRRGQWKSETDRDSRGMEGRKSSQVRGNKKQKMRSQKYNALQQNSEDFRWFFIVWVD